MLGFLGAILLIYANLPEEVDVTLGSRSISQLVLSRNSFFYAMIAVVVLSNGLLLALSKVVGLIKSPENGEDSGIMFRNRIINWLGCFSIVLNIFYIVGVFFVGFHNDPQYVAPESYNILVYGSILLIVACVLWLVVIALQRKRT